MTDPLSALFTTVVSGPLSALSARIADGPLGTLHERLASGPLGRLHARLAAGRLGTLYATLVWVADRIAAPLRTGDGPNKFRLSSVDTATTTYDGDVGWASRPPATVACPQCDAEILQHNARDSIDCPRCVTELDHSEFAEVELLYMTCPVCRNEMTHGQRHPERFDIPEWATCEQCRYHWEFEHSYD